MFAEQPGITWSINVGLDLTDADTVAIRLQKDGEQKSRDLGATATATGCTYVTDAQTFPTPGTYFFQVVASYVSPLKELLSEIRLIDIKPKIEPTT